MQPFQDSKESFFETSIRVHGIDWVVVFAYFDETGTSGGAERLTAVAGYLYDRDGITRFRRLFDDKVLPLLPNDKNGRRFYNTSKCVGGYDQFASVSASDRDRIVQLLADAVRESVTMGAVVAITPEDYTAGVSGLYLRVKTKDYSGDDVSPWVGTKYSACLIACVETICQWMDRQGITDNVEYVFEAGCNHEREASEILHRIAASPELVKRYRLHKYSFIPKGPDVPWLCAPDWLAWEWQRADRNSTERQRGEWRTVMADVVEAKPHLATYLTGASMAKRALFNSFYGLMKPGRPDA